MLTGKKKTGKIRDNLNNVGSQLATVGLNRFPSVFFRTLVQSTKLFCFCSFFELDEAKSTAINCNYVYLLINLF